MKFLILAVSYKYGGLCVAGLNLDTLEYVRIGKGDECAAIPSRAFKCKTERGEIQLKVLDVIDISAVKLINNGCQTENYQLKNINGYIERLAISNIDEIYRRLKKNAFVFLNNLYSVDINCINNINYSLQFVKVDNFTVSSYINTEGNAKLWASFKYNGNTYNGIRVTDSSFCAYPTCYGNVQKTCVNQKAYIMVSLPYDKWSIDFGKFYKYVSGIILI